MNAIHHYDWNQLMEIIDFIENEADFHPRWTVNYIVTLKSGYCTIDIGENTLGVEGTFGVSKKSKKEAVATCLEQFLVWYSQYKMLEQNILRAIQPMQYGEL